MLFSAAGRIAFAHYPKTAGSSITAWFRERFPDAVLVDPDDCHLPVRRSLVRLGLVPDRRQRPRIVRECLRIVDHIAPRPGDVRQRCDIRVIGVLREPCQMLVSLYHYWRRAEFRDQSSIPLIRTARTGTLRAFLRQAVGEEPVATYEKFFDVGGPAWHSTRLIDFDSLEHGLAEVCAEFGIEPPARLPRINAAPRQTIDIMDITGPMPAAAGPMSAVRSHFRWYYEQGTRIIVRGRQPALRVAA